MHRFCVVLLVATLLSGCLGPNWHEPRVPTEAEIQTELTARLKDDPNRDLCASIVRELNAGSIEAFTPYVNRSALVERGLARWKLPEERAERWRQGAEKIDALSRYHFPKRSKFYCLGTFPFQGEPALVVRLRQPSGSFGHVVLHLDPRGGDKPIDDYYVLQNGYWHSELQMFFEDPENEPHGDAHEKMLFLSFEKKYGEILAIYDALPERLKMHPIMFSHFLNASKSTSTMSLEQKRAVLEIAVAQVDEVFDHPQTRAHWKIHLLAQLRRRDEARSFVEALTQPFNDPLAIEITVWIDRL